MWGKHERVYVAAFAVFCALVGGLMLALAVYGQ